MTEDHTPLTKSPSAKSQHNANDNDSSMDSSNPYFIHHSDHPNHMLVLTKLNSANYQSWSKHMIHALTAKNKIGFIKGIIKPSSEMKQPTKFALWNQCNSVILSSFTHSVEPDLAKGGIHAKVAYQVWEDFKNSFHIKMHQQSITSRNLGLLHKTQGSLG